MNLYIRLAKTNIKNGKQFYFPYILTGILTVAMFYLVVYLATNSGVGYIRGGSYLAPLLMFGAIVIGIFAVIFLYYTNSFIMKRRKKEMGIYNILGMEKRHISRVLALEGIFTAIICIAGGLGFGILFSRLMNMLLYSIIRVNETIAFEISIPGIIASAILFSIIYFLTFIYNVIQINKSKTIELLHGSSVGEREPKTKILLTIVGVACMFGGYYIAITTVNPLSALALFFVAVTLVILGTYALFTAGSITFLKLLRKNKNFYYKSKNFSSISGMIYRMKQNAVGLANICILSTMVLVTASSTLCLYFGIEDILDSMQPNDIELKSEYTEFITDDEKLDEFVKSVIEESGRTIESYSSYAYLTLDATETENGFETYRYSGVTSEDGIENTTYLIPIDGVFILDKKSYDTSNLAEDEVIVIGFPKYTKDTIIINGETFKVASSEKYSENVLYDIAEYSEYYVLTNNEEAVERIYQIEQDRTMKYVINAEIDGEIKEQIICIDALDIAEYEPGVDIASSGSFYYVEGRAEFEQENYVMYGGLLFIGLFLGIMFLMATVLIIYYKQISEGFDDRQRFVIMSKVGMSDDEVKDSISAQIRMVFFIPLITAAIHMFGAFPMVSRMLKVFNFSNTSLFINCLIATMLIFAVIYYAVFKITSRSYYKIVGNNK